MTQKQRIVRFFRNIKKTHTILNCKTINIMPHSHSVKKRYISLSINENYSRVLILQYL